MSSTKKDRLFSRYVDDDDLVKEMTRAQRNFVCQASFDDPKDMATIAGFCLEAVLKLNLPLPKLIKVKKELWKKIESVQEK